MGYRGAADEDPGDDMVDKVVAQPDSLTTQEPLSYVSLISHWPFFWLAICYNNQKLEFTNWSFSFLGFHWTSYLRKSYSMNLFLSSKVFLVLVAVEEEVSKAVVVIFIS